MAKQQKRSIILFIMTIAAPLCLATGFFAGINGFSAPDWNTDIGRAIITLRANRVASGFFVGAGLACSGLILQALLRNPLADPYVLGVSGGAALGAAIAILAGFAAFGTAVLPATAFLFAVAAMALVYFLGSRGGRITIYGLLLSGVIISSVCSSLLMLMISLAPGEGLRTITWWMLGNLDGGDTGMLVIGAILISSGIAGAWCMSSRLDALTLGSDMAHHLGVRAGIATATGLALATLMTAAAVSMAGLIGFVGLIIPHAARSVTGASHRKCLPVAALCGGVFLVLCDALSRLLFGAASIPAGVITALIGGPFFLILLHRKKKGGWVE